MAGADFTALRDAIGQLRQCAGNLRVTYGDSPDVRRSLDDVDRLDIDAADLAGRPTPPKQRDHSGGKPEVVVVRTHRTTRRCGSAPTTRASEASAGLTAGGRLVMAMTRWSITRTRRT